MRLTVNGDEHDLDLDPRTTVLDALREHLDLTGAKKGCDHGQCGACTVLLDGRRVNSCLLLAVAHQDAAITTIEGLHDHPVQQGFLEHDGFQCGYCTPGQICSAVGMLDEARRGWPSAVTPAANTAAGPAAASPGSAGDASTAGNAGSAGDPSSAGTGGDAGGAVLLDDAEIRERMSGNLCRCGAYPNMVPAIRQAAQR